MLREFSKLSLIDSTAPTFVDSVDPVLFDLPLIDRSGLTYVDLIAQNYTGGPGNDVFIGTEDSDTADGGGGDDSLIGNGGNDFLAGNGGADYLNGGDGDDTLYSRDQSGAYGFPHYGYAWTAPTLDTGTEVDTLVGGSGSDRLFAGYGDNVDGETGSDYLLISFRGASAGVTANFNLTTNVIGGGTITNIEGVDWIEGSDFDDFITLGVGYASTGLTPIFGLGGNDLLVAGYFTGYMDGGDGNDIIDGRGSRHLQTVHGGMGDDTLFTPTNSFTSAYGEDGNDTIYAHSTISGGTGNDTIYVQRSFYAGQVHGDDGNDTIYAALTQPHIEIFGDAGNDTLIGSDYADRLDGGAGDDIIDGGGGDDTIDGGSGANTLRGGNGNDRFILGLDALDALVDGGADTDTVLFSASGNASATTFANLEGLQLVGGAAVTFTGAQFFAGFAANTTLSGTGTITINMDAGVPFSAGGLSPQAGSNITFTINGTSGIDIVKANMNVRNTINGGDSNDQIRGGNLVDTINGGNGNDKIMGLGGADVITGGAGNDQFRIIFTTDSGLGAAADHITDFVPGSDKLDFRALDADPVAPGQQFLTYIDTQAFHASGAAEVRYGVSGADLLVEVDLNGDGVADMQIVLDGDGALALGSGDFLVGSIGTANRDDTVLTLGAEVSVTGGAGAVGISDIILGSEKLEFQVLDSDPVAPRWQALAYNDSVGFVANDAGKLHYSVPGADWLVQMDGLRNMPSLLDHDAALTLGSGDFLL